MKPSNMPSLAQKSTKKTTVHYVNNPDFLKAIIEHKEKCKIAKEQGKENPKLSNYIGECISQIANRLSTNRNFIMYPFREEMISDGIENCLEYFDNFNPEITNNPFAYFTQIIYFAFLRRIQSEKKELYIKYKLYDKEMYMMNMMDQGEEISSIVPPKSDIQFMNTFVEDFENKLTEKKKGSKLKRVAKKKTTGVKDDL